VGERNRDGELGEAVARARSGGETAFGVVYRTVHPLLLGYARALVGDEAEDVTSKVWPAIAPDLGRFRGDGAGFRGWAATPGGAPPDFAGGTPAQSPGTGRASRVGEAIRPQR
jgi:hypothetical protein